MKKIPLTLSTYSLVDTRNQTCATFSSFLKYSKVNTLSFFFLTQSHPISRETLVHTAVEVTGF